MLTASRVRDLLDYNPETGALVWKVRRGNVMAGRAAGRKQPTTGYLAVKIDGTEYSAHRIAWLHVHGEWPPPPLIIDHINCNILDNCIANLRLATRSQNMAYAKRMKTNTSGLKGVSWYRQTSRWTAGIHFRGKNIHLGYFHNPEDAHAAYCRAAVELYGEFARFA
jgi:hypothetical protein